MKHVREIKVGVLSVICLFLLYFGFNYLKGVDIFSPVHTYYGYFAAVPDLTEQAPVLIRGYKVGQVDRISYDFTRDSAFLVEVSVDKHIIVPKGSEMAMVATGLLGGNAIEIVIPTGADLSNQYATGDYLPTHVVPGLMDKLQDELLAELSATIKRVNEVVDNLGNQLDNSHIENTLANVDAITTDLKTTSRDLKRVVGTQVPEVINHVDAVVGDLNTLTASLNDANIVGKVDTAVEGVNGLIADVRSTDGTLGMLLNDKTLYLNVNAAVTSADSLLTDIKARPRHYLYPLGAKEKKKK